MKNSDIWTLLRDLAPELGYKPHEIRLWRHRKRIPGHWHMRIAEAAARKRVKLTHQDFEDLPA